MRTTKALKKPNVVLVFADEWRGQAAGYAGDPNCKTPTLDSFAKKSVIFTNAVSGTSVCCPYRASLMTGQYALTHGVIINDVPLDPDCYSLARAFSDQGYNTGYIGKWHLYGSPKGRYERRRRFVPRRHQLGFDYWKGFECTHNYNNSDYYFNGDRNKRRWKGYDAFAQSRDAARYIKKHSRDDKPFLLLLSWGPPHFPLFSAPEKYKKIFREMNIKLRNNVPTGLKDRAARALKGYYAHISALDDCFKLVWDSVHESGIEDDTVFIFTSDHGDMMFSQGIETKIYPFDESVSVPFLLHYPPVTGKRKRAVTVPIDAPDIMPTLLGLCGLRIPRSVEGKDWSGYVRGEQTPTGNEAAFLSMPAEFATLIDNDMRAYRGLRSSRYTYVRNTKGPWLLFDNLKDPYQMNNLIDSPDHAKTRKLLERELKKRLKERKDGFLESKEYLRLMGLEHYRETRRTS